MTGFTGSPGLFISHVGFALPSGEGKKTENILSILFILSNRSWFLLIKRERTSSWEMLELFSVSKATGADVPVLTEGKFPMPATYRKGEAVRTVEENQTAEVNQTGGTVKNVERI